ncbi:hypothetical protein OUZ56_001257 [Daphnia magna]|uniref:Uncharacterized protein n=1 Tax=Daphnia magna TaxID=35525 RepID=A0ABR0A246_9CRUS|nr:hypothetical protein OUZ56_001257 [Daphnia magna]
MKPSFSAVQSNKDRKKYNEHVALLRSDNGDDVAHDRLGREEIFYSLIDRPSFTRGGGCAPSLAADTPLPARSITLKQNSNLFSS